MTAINFALGSRRLWAVPRNLVTVSVSLPELVAGTLPHFPPCPESVDGYRILSAPQSALSVLCASRPAFVPGGVQHYARHYIDMQDSFADYMGRFSGKTRSTLRRKIRKFAAAGGGSLDVREYR
ncbi:MAG: GNAT family N-acetyltransferase, partial [Sphingomonadaceae bacterium]